MLKEQMQGVNDYVRSEKGATAIAAGVITTAAGTALGYFGGKTAVATACMVGGGLMAIAATFAVSELGVRSLVRGWSFVARKLEKRPEPIRQDQRQAQAS